VRALLLTVSDLADQAVIVPVVVTVAILLLVARERRAALWWCVAMAVALGGTLCAKLLFIPCGPHFGLPVRSPSGHAAAAVSVYGGLFVLAGRLGLSRAVAIGLGCMALGLAGAVGASRVLLHAHTLPEVLVGGTIGLAAPLILQSVRPLYVTSSGARLRWLAAAPVLVSVLFMGGHAGAEPRIARFAYLWAQRLQVCQPPQARAPFVLPVAGHSPAGAVAFGLPARFEG
jgi:membrane-associated phospholipid phosphatase